MLRKWELSVLRNRGDKPQPGNEALPAAAGKVRSIGGTPWGNADLRQSLGPFLEFYANRPAVDPGAGLCSPGAWALWFLLGRLRPARVILAGVEKGLATWIAERRLPEAGLIGVVGDPARVQYRAARARYLDGAFPDLEAAALGLNGGAPDAFVFFEDHGDAMPRVKRCLELGVKRMCFEGNYPAFEGRRHMSLGAYLNDQDAEGNPRHPGERAFLLERAKAYFVFPPPFDYDRPVTLEETRIEEDSLCGRFDPARDASLSLLHADMPGYRWTSYLELK